jgi:simple sugar transport system permease protein
VSAGGAATSGGGALLDRTRGVAFGLAAGLVAFDLMVLGYGASPAFMARLLFEGTWGTSYGVGQVLFKATPLVVVAVAVDCALRTRLFNVGAEGQLAVASLVAGVVGARLGAAPAIVGVPLTVTAAAAAGGLWAAGPALMRVRLKAHEVITTILMNKLADGVVGFALASGAAMEGTVRTASIGRGARIPRLDALGMPFFQGSAVSLAVLVGALLLGAIPFVYRRTAWGREVVLVGQNERACAREGVPVGARMIQSFVASGAVVGLASGATVLGYKGYFEEGLGAGVGFAGLGVALLGRGSAVGIGLAALLFATLQQGGLAINAHVPKEAMDVLQAVIIVAVALGDGRLRTLLASRAEVPS